MQLTADGVLHNEVCKKFLKAQTVLDLDRNKKPLYVIFYRKTLKELKTLHNTVISTDCVIDARSKALDGIKNVVWSAVNFCRLATLF